MSNVIIEKWVKHLAAARRSPRTIRLRRYYVQRFAKEYKLTTANTDDIETWLGGHEWARATARSARTSLREVFEWMQRTGVRIDNPAQSLIPISESAPSPHPTPDKVYLEALAGADDRVRLMMRLAGEAGLRRAEVAQVHLRDISIDDYGVTLIVHGKGDKLREVPLGAGLARELRLACIANGGWAFPSFIGNHLTADRVGHLVARELPQGWSMHSLRHRFATKCWDGSHDLLSVSALLGHANISTTKRYIAMSRRRLREVAQAAA